MTAQDWSDKPYLCSQNDAAENRPRGLTPQRASVLAHIAKGKENREIIRLMGWKCKSSLYPVVRSLEGLGYIERSSRTRWNVTGLGNRHIARPAPKTTEEAIADAELRLTTIIAAGHTQMINVRADTLRVLIEAAKSKESAQ